MDKEKQAENDKQIDHTQLTTKHLYKQNLDLVLRNKFLSLLQKFYEISIEAFDPKSLSSKFSNLIQSNLESELVAIYTYNKTNNILEPLHYSVSEKFVESCKMILSNKLSANPIISPD